MEALRREVREKAGAAFGEAFPFAKLSTTAYAPVMLLDASKCFQLGALTTSGDVFGRDVIPVVVFLSCYSSDRALMRAILDGAVQHLRPGART